MSEAYDPKEYLPAGAYVFWGGFIALFALGGVTVLAAFIFDGPINVYKNWLEPWPRTPDQWLSAGTLHFLSLSLMGQNLVGAFCLGLLQGRWRTLETWANAVEQERPELTTNRDWLRTRHLFDLRRSMWATGFCGAVTTYGGLAAILAPVAQSLPAMGRGLWAGFLLLLAGVVMVGLGLAVGKRLGVRSQRRLEDLFAEVSADEVGSDDGSAEIDGSYPAETLDNREPHRPIEKRES